MDWGNVCKHSNVSDHFCLADLSSEMQFPQPPSFNRLPNPTNRRRRFHLPRLNFPLFAYLATVHQRRLASSEMLRETAKAIQRR